VVDDHQRRGIGTLLLDMVALTARQHGIDRLVATVLSDNKPVTELLHGFGSVTRWDRPSGTVRVEVPIGEDGRDIRDSGLYELLRAAARGAVEVDVTAPPRRG
jgi:GNAT superfamily N-acetyltransferase